MLKVQGCFYWQFVTKFLHSFNFSFNFKYLAIVTFVKLKTNG